MFKSRVLRCVIVFWVSGLSLAWDTSLGQVRFEDPINLSNNPRGSWNPNIAAVDDQVFVFWLDQVPGRSDIGLAHSRDNGLTFRTWDFWPEIQYSYPASVVADGDNIYVAWGGQVDLRDQTTRASFLSRSNDGGETFEPPFDMSGRGIWGSPTLQTQEGVLYAAWGGTYPGCAVGGIFFTQSTDLGKTFSEPILVSDNSQCERNISRSAFAVNGDQVYVAWMGQSPGFTYYDIYFRPSTDGGKSFGEIINLSHIRQARELSTQPQLAVGGNGYVYAAWSQGLDQDPMPPPLLLDVYVIRSTDGGKTFDPPINLSKDPRGWNLGVRMGTSGDHVYVVWSGRSGTAGGVLFSRSTDGGETFSEPQSLSQNRGGSPELAIIEKGKLLDDGLTDDVIYVVWQDDRPGVNSAFFSVSLDDGETFSEPENISNSFADQPRLAAVGRNVYVTWMGRAAGHFDAFLIRGQLDLDRKSH